MRQPNDALEIREATAADVPVILNLERQSDTAAHWSPETYRHLFASTSSKRVLLLMEDRHSAVAFLVARIVGVEWEIENIVVGTQMRRQGLASWLIRDLVVRAQNQGAQTILLEVRQSNTPARALYQKTGFIECGRRPNYYHFPDEDAVCYRLEFQNSSHHSEELGTRS